MVCTRVLVCRVAMFVMGDNARVFVSAGLFCATVSSWLKGNTDILFGPAEQPLQVLVGAGVGYGREVAARVVVRGGEEVRGVRCHDGQLVVRAARGRKAMKKRERGHQRKRKTESICQ